MLVGQVATQVLSLAYVLTSLGDAVSVALLGIMPCFLPSHIETFHCVALLDQIDELFPILNLDVDAHFDDSHVIKVYCFLPINQV